MGVLNRIMLILILLAAAGAAILSYFLFEKRTEMLKGWQLMADQIDSTAKKMDQGSGTKVAADIKSKEFTHRDLSAMESRLKKLSAAAENLVQQRDALVETVSSLSYIAAGKTIDNDKLLQLESYEAYRKEVTTLVKNQVQKERNAHRTIVGRFAKAGSFLGINTASSKIENDLGKDLLAKIQAAVNAKNQLISQGNTGFNTLADVVSTSHTENAFKGSSEAIYSAIEKLKAELSAAKNGRAKAEGDVRRLTGKVNTLEKLNIKLGADVKKLQRDIVRLKNIINPTNDPNVNRMEYQPKDMNYYMSLYSLVRKEVKKVDRKWNFVIVDLGAKTTVQQTFAGKTYKTILDITPGKTMTVVRGIKTNNPKVIARVVLAEVHADHAVANIMLDTVQDTIKEGDAVIFLNEDKELLKMDIQKLLSNKK